MKYFAYGSNMDPERMKSRKVPFTARKWAILRGYSLTFDKKAMAGEGIGYGNIVKCEHFRDSSVEGILYEIDEPGLWRLDNCEGYPHHYDRKELKVELTDGTNASAWTYTARPEKVSKGLEPTREYLSHYLKGSDLLSREYVEMLSSVETFD